MEPMTFEAARDAIRTIGCSLRLKGGEYRVNFFGGKEETAYYTNDLSDAIETAKAMIDRKKWLTQVLRPNH